MDDQDETDANRYNSNNNGSENNDGDSVILTSVMSDIYNMSHGGKGKAIIFNHYEFDDANNSPRKGTDVDAKNLEKTLSNLGFSVTVYRDLKYGDIYDVIQEAAEEDHSQSSSLVVAVMSHGEQGYIHSRDHKYKPETLWMPFTECKTLVGKPKVFFIQACRGDEVDNGVKVTSRSTFIQRDASGSQSYTIPVMADILVMYSTYEGYYSWRNPVSGSWFIECLCTELRENAAKKDLVTILTFVNRRMAIGYESNVPSAKNMHHKKQIGSIVSTLTRRLYFNK